MSFDEIIHKEINKGMARYTVMGGPNSNVGHVVGLIVNDILRDNGPLAAEVRRQIASSYDNILSPR